MSTTAPSDTAPSTTAPSDLRRDEAGSIVFGPMLEAALASFHEHGYGGATVRDIAGRVGVTVPALYYHHANKEAMLFALLDQAISQLYERVAATRDPAASGLQRWDAAVEVLVRHNAANTRLAYLDSEIRSLTEEHRALYTRRRGDVEALVLAALEQAISEGDLAGPHPRETCRAMLGMVQAISGWYRPDGELDISSLARLYQQLARRLAGRAAPTDQEDPS